MLKLLETEIEQLNANPNSAQIINNTFYISI